VILVGVGAVEQALVDQIRRRGDTRRPSAGDALRLAGLVDRGGGLYNEHDLSERQGNTAMAAKKADGSIASVASASEGRPDPRELVHRWSMFVGATDADGVVATWLAALRRGGSVVVISTAHGLSLTQFKSDVVSGAGHLVDPRRGNRPTPVPASLSELRDALSRILDA